MTDPGPTPVWAYGDPAPPPTRTRPDQRLFAFLAIAIGLGAVLSIAAGWLWVTLADPPTVPLADNGGLFLGEAALNQLSGVTLWFIVVGAAFGAVVGLLLGWFGQRFGWLTVVAVLLACGIGTLLSQYLGIHVFGPDQAAQAAGASVGDPVQVAATVDTWVAYLGWPIGGLVGALAAIVSWSRADDSRDRAPSPTLPVPVADREP